MLANITLPDSCPIEQVGPAQLFLTLIQTLLATKCRINSNSNYPPDRKHEIKNGDTFDFIVVGGGSAGSVVTSKLAENPKWRVLLLEAGTYPSWTSDIPALVFHLTGTKEDLSYRPKLTSKAFQGLKNKECNWSRGKALGGCSATNAMIYLRGNKRDYTEWSEAGNPEWSYEQVLKYFKLNENAKNSSDSYGKNGEVSITQGRSTHLIRDLIKESANNLGYSSCKEEPNVGYFDCHQTINGTRVNAAKAFLKNVKDNENLYLALNVDVQRILIEKKRAKGVEIVVNGEKMNFFASKEVILSAGTLGSTKLLLSSGIGPKPDLSKLGIETKHSLPGVGKNLQDHGVFFGKMYKIPENTVDDLGDPIDWLYEYFHKQSGILTRLETNLIGFISTENSTTYPDIQFHHWLLPKNDLASMQSLQRLFNLNEVVSQQQNQALTNSPAMILGPILLKPKSRGQISLKSSNPKDEPIIDTGFFEDESDLETMVKAMKYVDKLVQTPPLSEYKIEPVDLGICLDIPRDSDEFIRCELQHLTTSIFHPVGTCKMGPKSDPTSVVSSELKVHGVTSLRVIDGSIMPTIVSANTNAACMMIGRRGVSFILDEWDPKYKYQMSLNDSKDFFH